MTSIDNLAEEIMQGLQEYADLADTAMKKAVRKSATQVKNEISANAPADTGKYAISQRLSHAPHCVDRIHRILSVVS